MRLKAQQPQGASEAEESAERIAQQLAERLREERNRRNWTLDRLAQASGVSRTMLWQIEQGRSAPTIKVLARLAEAFGIEVAGLLSATRSASAYLLRRGEGKVLRAENGSSESRALFPYSGQHSAEIYEIRVTAGALDTSEGHAPGTHENVFVLSGELDVVVDGLAYSLCSGDALHFAADLPHAYHNRSPRDATAILVISHPLSLSLG